MPKRAVVSIEDLCRVKDPAEVRASLAANPEVERPLLEALEAAGNYFPGAEIELDLFLDPEDSEDEVSLYLDIWIEAEQDDAIKRFRLLRDEKLLGLFVRAKGKFCVSPRFK